MAADLPACAHLLIGGPCREAIIVCLADKYCAVVESMFRRAKVATTVGADGADDTEW